MDFFFADVPADGPCSSHFAIDEGRPLSKSATAVIVGAAGF
jgi:hypothetical protein